MAGWDGALGWRNGGLADRSLATVVLADTRKQSGLSRTNGLSGLSHTNGLTRLSHLQALITGGGGREGQATPRYARRACA